MDIRRIIDDSGTRAGRAFTVTIQVLIVLSLVSFSIETLPDLDAGTRAALRAFES